MRRTVVAGLGPVLPKSINLRRCAELPIGYNAPVDEYQADLAKPAIDGVIQTAQRFLEALLGPAAGEAGLLLQDKVRFFRF